MRSVMRSMKVLTLITLLSGVFIATLFLASNNIANSGGFVRKFPPHLAEPQATFDLGFSSFYIAGGDARGFYLANYTAPLQMVRLNYDLDTTHFRMKVPGKVLIDPGSVRVRVDSPYVYFSEGKRPLVLYGAVKDFKIDKVQDTSIFFLNSEPVSSYSTIGTVYDYREGITTIAKKSVNRPVTTRSGVLQKQLDGLFCMDGQLNYNDKASAVVYVYSYRNQFVRLDTSLNIVYSGRTIDTTDHVQLAVDTVSKSQEITFSKPPFVVNRKSCINDRWLFVHSALRASNEDESLLEETYPIDVYDLANGKYKFSFYISAFRKMKVTSMRAFGDRLVIVAGSFVHTYKLNF